MQVRHCCKWFGRRSRRDTLAFVQVERAVDGWPAGHKCPIVTRELLCRSLYLEKPARQTRFVYCACNGGDGQALMCLLGQPILAGRPH